MQRDRRAFSNIRLFGLYKKQRATNYRFFSLLMLIVVTTVCGGCFRTNLPKEPISSHLPRLITLAEQQIPLIIQNEFDDQALGHQYLLFLPVSRIYAPYLADTLQQRLTLQAGLNKWGLIAQSNSVLSTPRLEVKIQKAHLDGFDLFAIRRPSAHLIVKGTLFKSDKSVRECTSIQNFSEFRAFAFTEELRETLQATIDTVARDLINCLGFASPAAPYPDSYTDEMY